ncbi:DddA-like double-stranded DNA deaminase toxin [Lentzea californiensis]|uniref:DddA-like double-stranded DNA deaminase toxin n=1 Tax=Lentzea californiensis TaxID=438851 RepID=UPI002165C8E9|nr:DddA-like double-stranded DNA deaminase toxin [Lentzea californiensis]MCR3751211.1 SCP1.201-like deaminase [Lentzea californiensis]
MATFSEISTQIERACELASKAREFLESARESASDAITLFVNAMDGSVDPEAETTHEQWQHARNEIQALGELLGAAIASARSYQGPLSPPSARLGQAVPAPTGSRGQSGTSSIPSEVSAERADEVRGELSRPVNPMTDPGRKTHGRWVGPDGQVHAIVSGKDEDSHAAGELLQRLGMPVRRITRSSHVAMKLAARMVRDGIPHVAVFIQRTV